MPINLDLRTGLKKVLTNTSMADPGSSCTYTGPCAVGVMMTPKERDSLRRVKKDQISIGNLISDGLVVVPDDQRGDFIKLQSAFDWGTHFWTVFAQLSTKYPQ